MRNGPRDPATQYEMETMRNAERNDAVCCSKVLSIADFTSWRLIKMPGSHLSRLSSSWQPITGQYSGHVITLVQSEAGCASLAPDDPASLITSSPSSQAFPSL